MHPRPPHPPPFDIYEDPISHPHQPHQRSTPQLQPSCFPLHQPMRNQMPTQPDLFDQHSYQMHPGYAAMSPQKISQHMQGPPGMPVAPELAFVPQLPVPDHNYHRDGMSPYKRTPPTAPPPFIPHQMQQPALDSGFNPSLNTFEQDPYPTTTANDNADFPSPNYNQQRSQLKRSYSDVMPSIDRPNKRPRIEETAVMVVPAPEDMPKIEDTPNGDKPSYSYATMIAFAILRAPGRKLTLSQIYAFISRTWSFYQPSQDSKTSWHNSIRHNLSLNKAFQKVDRPKNDPGKGSYWTIVEGQEYQFLKAKNRVASNSQPSMIINTRVMPIEPLSLSQPTLSQPTLSQPLPTFSALEPSPFINESRLLQRPQTAPALPELSSDATLPDSDPALTHDVDQETIASAGSQQELTHFSPQGLNSSPPVMSKCHRRSDSSPSMSRQFHSSNIKPPHHRSHNDSGYYSSIYSSAARPNTTFADPSSELESDTGNKRTKMGTAQYEIQQIRRQSPRDFTPTKKHMAAAYSSMPPPMSSPVRSSPLGRVPFTPAQGFKKPALPPPPSVSPGTQLLNFRGNVESQFTTDPSPRFDLTSVEATSCLSPGYWPTTTPGRGMDNGSPFIYEDMIELTPNPHSGDNMGNMSPLRSVKRSITEKRPQIGRANTATNILTAIDGNGAAARKLHSAFDTPTKLPAALKLAPPTNKYNTMSTGSPVKGLSTIDDHNDENNENDFSKYLNFGEDEEPEEEYDLLHFEPIRPSNGTTMNPINIFKNPRPTLGGRSQTSRF